MNFEQERREFWKDMWLAYTASSNSNNPNGGTNWADHALKDFDERFKDDDTTKDYPSTQAPIPL